jgi:hypothetical protein
MCERNLKRVKKGMIFDLFILYFSNLFQNWFMHVRISHVHLLFSLSVEFQLYCFMVGWRYCGQNESCGFV